MTGGYSRYEDALAAKLRLLDFSESHLGQRFLHGFQASMNAMHRPAERLPDGLIHALQTRMLRDADPVYVSHDMTEVVDNARKSFSPETLLPSDPFVPCGFALFPRPIVLDDAPVTEANPFRSPQGLIPVRALAWMAMHSEDLETGCFWISHYTHTDDDDQYGRHDDPEMSPEQREGLDALRRQMPLSLVHTWQWTWGVDPRGPGVRAGLVEGEDPERSEKRAHEQASMAQAFWRIASQFVPVKRRVPRQMWREAQRKRARVTKEVTVITLRRSTEVGDGETAETGRHYQVSFLVRGYWAIRHTRDGPRQVWVKPHLKGQGPFQDTERAWEFKR